MRAPTDNARPPEQRRRCRRLPATALVAAAMVATSCSDSATPGIGTSAPGPASAAEVAVPPVTAARPAVLPSADDVADALGGHGAPARQDAAVTSLWGCDEISVDDGTRRVYSPVDGTSVIVAISRVDDPQATTVFLEQRCGVLSSPTGDRTVTERTEPSLGDHAVDYAFAGEGEHGLTRIVLTGSQLVSVSISADGPPQPAWLDAVYALVTGAP